MTGKIYMKSSLVAKSILFIVVTFFLYYTGGFFDMIIFNRMCSSLYGSYAYLLSTVYLMILCFYKKQTRASLIYLGIPLLGFAVAFLTHSFVSNLILLKSHYCFYIYSFTGLIAIILGEKSKREQI
jgi:hypothetical protein